MTMKNLYLLLAIIGAIVPWALFWPFLQDDGGPAFIPALFANGAVSGLTFDLVISSLAFWVFMFHLRARGRGPAPWAFMAINLLIGLSCALPAYLWWREKPEAGA